MIPECFRVGDPVRVVGEAEGEGSIIGFYRRTEDDDVVVRLETGRTQIVPATRLQPVAA